MPPKHFQRCAPLVLEVARCTAFREANFPFLGTQFAGLGKSIPGGGSISIFMKKLTAEQFKEYAADPLATDEKVRTWCSVPEDRYYTVATWPEERAGELRLTTDLHRVVRAPKISKSNQAQAAS